MIINMEKLTTNYLGLTLKSPLIVSSSRLTSTIENLKEAEENGAGAVVLKSFFEEQIMHHISTLSYFIRLILKQMIIFHIIPNHIQLMSILSLIRNAKKNLTIPVIPSINCFSSERMD